jgi:hypothetical protein
MAKIVHIFLLEAIKIAFVVVTFLRTPKLLDIFNYESKGESNERTKNWGMFFGL